MPADCRVCAELLFDVSSGAAVKGAVARTKCCRSLVHAKCVCLATTKTQVASDSSSNSGSKMGLWLAGSSGESGTCLSCPVCRDPSRPGTDSNNNNNMPSYDHEAAWSEYWIPRMQACLQRVGPVHGPVPVSRIQKMLDKDDDMVASTEQSKYYLWQERDLTVGFLQALQDGDHIWVNRDIGGSDKDESTVATAVTREPSSSENETTTTTNRQNSRRNCYQEGIWVYDEQDETLWLHSEWGPVPDTVLSAAAAAASRRVLWTRALSLATLVVVMASCRNIAEWSVPEPLSEKDFMV